MKLAIIDFNRTIYDPENGVLIPGAKDGLVHLVRKGLTLILVSRREPGRAAMWETLGVADYFVETHFVDEKTEALFRDIATRYGAHASETYVIGDYLPDEIRVGNSIGAKTIHFRPHMHARSEMERHTPWKTMREWKDIRDIV